MQLYLIIPLVPHKRKAYASYHLKCYLSFIIPPKDNVTGGYMEDKEKMTVDERYKYLRQMQKRYKKAGRKERGRLLDEMEAVTSLHRKSLIRLMNSNIVRRKRIRQRGVVYGSEVKYVVAHVARSLNYPGGRAAPTSTAVDSQTSGKTWGD